MILTDGIHLVSDENLAELHRFARKIGLKRIWYQHHRRHPHYDIWGSKVKKALDAGAVEVTKRDIIKRVCKPSLHKKR